MYDAIPADFCRGKAERACWLEKAKQASDLSSDGFAAALQSTMPLEYFIFCPLTICTAKCLEGALGCSDACFLLPINDLGLHMSPFLQAVSAEEKAHAIQEGAQRILKTLEWLRKHRFMPPAQLKEWQHMACFPFLECSIFFPSIQISCLSNSCTGFQTSKHVKIRPASTFHLS